MTRTEQRRVQRKTAPVSDCVFFTLPEVSYNCIDSNGVVSNGYLHSSSPDVSTSKVRISELVCVQIVQDLLQGDML